MATKTKRPWPVFIAMILAILVGPLVGTERGLFGVTFYSMFDLLGTLFIRALMMVVVPLVASSVIAGLARLGKEGGIGKLGLRTFTLYLGTNFAAIVVSILVVNLMQPGAYFHGELPQAMLPSPTSAEEGRFFADLLFQIVPSNIIDAFSKGQMLAVIFFSILFGLSLSHLSQERGAALVACLEGVFETMLRVTLVIMKFLPYGVFCLIAKVFATTGWDSLASLGVFLAAVLMGLLIFACVVLPLALRFLGGLQPWRHFQALGPALVAAFSTSSSSAALPITMECVEKRAGVSNRVCSLVVPLGCSVNLAGSALYECVAAMFVAQAYGIDLSLSTQLTVLLVTLIASVGVAAVPSGSLIAIIIILGALRLPPEAIGLFIAVDRLLDMCRTTVNVLSTSCCAVLVAKMEGENVLTTSHFEV